MTDEVSLNQMARAGDETVPVREIFRRASNDAVLVEIARKAIEDAAIATRQRGIGHPNAANGITCLNADGSPSYVIRVWTPDAIILALKAIAGADDLQVAQMRSYIKAHYER